MQVLGDLGRVIADGFDSLRDHRHDAVARDRVVIHERVVRRGEILLGEILVAGARVIGTVEVGVPADCRVRGAGHDRRPRRVRAGDGHVEAEVLRLHGDRAGTRRMPRGDDQLCPSFCRLRRYVVKSFSGTGATSVWNSTPCRPPISFSSAALIACPQA